MDRRTRSSIGARRSAAAFLVLAATLAALASVSLAASGPAVTVKVQAPNRTLLRPTVVHGGHGWITKGGAPRGKCPAASAAGALNNATHGHWNGKYYSSVGGIFVTSILGDKPKNPRFWELLVNGQAASKGVCSVKLKQGERLTFKVSK